jgi:hypothetical protein
VQPGPIAGQILYIVVDGAAQLLHACAVRATSKDEVVAQSIELGEVRSNVSGALGLAACCS